MRLRHSIAVLGLHAATVTGMYYLRTAHRYSAVADSDVVVFFLPTIIAMGLHAKVISSLSVKTFARFIVATLLAGAGLLLALLLSLNLWGA